MKTPEAIDTWNQPRTDEQIRSFIERNTEKVERKIAKAAISSASLDI